MARGTVRYRVLVWTALALAVLGLTAYLAAPWPSVWVIRWAFDRGAASAAAALEKHLPEGVTMQAAVHYDASDPDALFDVLRPANVDARAPTIVWIHGGGFVSGRRGDLTNYLKILASRGFAIVNVDYTIAPKAIYPTPIRQVARALAFVDRNASRLQVNREALVLAGDSAGAQIAAQVANVITSPRYANEVGIPAPVTAGQLKGALLHCGVYDLGRFDPRKGGILGWFMGTVTRSYSGDRDWRRVRGFEYFSVAQYLTPAFPPTFIGAGNADPLGSQSLLMERELRSKAVAVESLFYPPDHRPALSHEYQFNLDGVDGQRALAQSVAWLTQLTSNQPRQ